ncbi:MAG TPA: polysaccharide biosynthesis/export family protein [Steroidobacteraceae bacterium]|nr:polysaccharide biosynthesis/export family protein [Steroidobacteraceae bacterium]
MKRHSIPLIATVLAFAAAGAQAAGSAAAPVPYSQPQHAQTMQHVDAGYAVQAGDILTVTVWKEADLTGDVLVRPDGALSLPLAGDIQAAGRTVDDIRQEITDRLKRYIPDPVVTVSAKAVLGNYIYVVGKVLKPGEFPIVRAVDVMQALALAGGMTPFAAQNDIVVLRRDNGVQRALHFRYSAVARGKNLGQNILLRSGDTVVVP